MTPLHTPNLEPLNWLEDALLDLQIYRLRRVGHKHMGLQILWEEWIRR